MYISRSWLYRGTAPDTVVLLSSFIIIGEARVHNMTEAGYGSPDATPWVNSMVRGSIVEFEYACRLSSCGTGRLKLGWL